MDPDTPSSWQICICIGCTIHSQSCSYLESYQKRKLETGRSDQSIQVVTSWNYVCTHLHITNYFVSGLQFLWPWALKELPQVRSQRLTPLQRASSLSLKDMFSTIFLFPVIERPMSVPLKKASLPRFGSLYGQVHGGHPNTTVTPNFTAAVEYAFFCPSDSLQPQKFAGTLHSQCTWHWGQSSWILILTMQATTWLLELNFEFSNLPFSVVVTVVEFHNTIPLIFCSSYWWFCLCNL